MTSAHGELREAGRAVREARALLAETLRRHDRLTVHLNTAWREQEDVTERYQRLLVGLLRVLDNCTSLGAVRDGLRTLLDEHGVEPIPVEPGDPFDGERHHNQETVSIMDIPAGVVVDVLADGYLRRAEGRTLVVRPAMVRVSAGERE